MRVILEICKKKKKKKENTLKIMTLQCVNHLLTVYKCQGLLEREIMVVCVGDRNGGVTS